MQDVPVVIAGGDLSGLYAATAVQGLADLPSILLSSSKFSPNRIIDD
ncbi:hypothetical protein [Psychrobacter sp. FME5]|nr:hypothetical protein [Psychrobacter sp. FME5]MBE0444903.1 hypothetical protein [Psychrobacter sp. FME5]MDN5892234.1 hypothetical protein [Psychrobacter sp.]